MTIRDAKTLLRPYGITLRKTDFGEFRVAFAGRPGESTDATAAYETDLQAAVDTGLAMARSAT